VIVIKKFKGWWKNHWDEIFIVLILITGVILLLKSQGII